MRIPVIFFDHLEQSSDSKGSIYVHTSGIQYSGFQLLTHQTTFCLHFPPAQVCKFGAACAQLCISVLPWIQVGLMQAVFKYHFLNDFQTRLLLQSFFNCSICCHELGFGEPCMCAWTCPFPWSNKALWQRFFPLGFLQGAHHVARSIELPPESSS